ncbi:MAG: hypothetical protein ACLUD0_17655 [Eubacterium ramulus]
MHPEDRFVLQAELLELGSLATVRIELRSCPPVLHVDIVALFHQFDGLALADNAQYGVPPKSLVMLYFPSENAPAPPKPHMIGTSPTVDTVL